MIYTISNKFLKATINSFGAEVTSLVYNERNYIWNGNPEFWDQHAPILFPIVGCLKEAYYIYNDEKYELSRHGFAKKCDFELVSQSETDIVFSLKHDANSKKIYPFAFELKVTYAVSNTDLKMSYEVINCDTKQMPFSIGAHPAFALPQNITNYSLLFDKQEVLQSFVLQNHLLSDSFFEIELQDKILPLDYSLFENDALIFKTIQSKKVTILENNLPLLSVSFSDFKNFGIWTKPNAPFLCLEPWLGYADTTTHNHLLADKEGIQILEENCTFEASLTISLITNAAN